MSEQNEYVTKRPTNSNMEALMGVQLPVLDHGFIELQDYMGDQQAIIDAARNSYQNGTKSFREDRGLLRYLMRKHHTSPFEMAEIKLHVKLPIFVARQWVRHRTASINEVSARYSVLESEFYLPTADDLGPQSTLNKQGRDGTLNPEQAKLVRRLLKEDALAAYEHYTVLLGDSQAPEYSSQEGFTLRRQEHGALELHEDDNYPGISRELARMNLSLNFYTRWTWKTDVHNFMNFLRLRNDRHAQLEIKRYAERMQDMLRVWMPQVHEAFEDYVQNAVSFSGPAANVLRHLIAGNIQAKDLRHELGKVLEKRELEETIAALVGVE